MLSDSDSDGVIIHELDELVETAQRIYHLAEDQADELLRQLNHFTESHSDDEWETFDRVWIIGYVRLYGYITAVDVERLAWSLERSPRWVREVLNTSHYYRIKPSEDNWGDLCNRVSLNSRNWSPDRWEFYQLNSNYWGKFD